MRGYSRVFLIGNLTRDPEIRFLPSGKSITTFTLAVNRTYTLSSGEKREETSFIPVQLMGKQAEVANQFLRKGSPVFVEGRLRQRSWETPEGQRRSVLEVVGLGIEFLAPKEKVLEETKESLEEEFIPEEEIIEEEEAPF
jgi:single-strand DNA-binding protein